MVESLDVPDFCTGCGTANGDWMNLTTMRVENKPVIPLAIPHSMTAGAISPLAARKKKTPKPKGAAKGPGVAPSPAPAYTPSPAYTPIFTPSPPAFIPSPGSGGDFIRNLFDNLTDLVKESYVNVTSAKKWPYIIAAILAIFSGGKIFSSQVLLFVIFCVTLVLLSSVVTAFHICSSRNSFFANIVVTSFFLFAFSVPYNFIFRNTSSLHFLNNAKQEPAPIKVIQVYAKSSVVFHSTPSNERKTIALIHPLDILTLTGKNNGNWLEANFNGQSGWVLNSSLRYYSDPTEIRVRLAQGMAKVNIRTAPSSHSNIIFTTGADEVCGFIELSNDGKWVHIRDRNGNQGWIWRKYITPV